MAVTDTEAAIYDALMDKVVQVAAVLALPISLPNVNFTPPAGTGKRLPYLAVTYMPNGAALDGLPFDSDETHVGLLQVSVFWPAGEGIVKPLQVAAQVAAAFPAGMRFARNGVEVSVDQKATTAGAIQESDLTQVPVTVRWSASASPSA